MGNQQKSHAKASPLPAGLTGYETKCRYVHRFSVVFGCIVLTFGDVRSAIVYRLELVIEQTKGHLLTDWSQINWASVERIVKRLQGRIFRAVRAGKLAKVKSLQKLLARSSSAKLLAIRKTCQQNRGRNTPGIDGALCKTPEARISLFKQGLSFKGYRPKRVRRIFVEKKGGGMRPLGIPTLTS